MPFDLAALDRLHAASTQGEWRKGIDDPNDGLTPCVFAGDVRTGPYIADCTWDGAGERQNADAAWIAASHNAYPDLAAELKALREWKSAILGVIRHTIPEYTTGQWGGDKEGWGFCFEMIAFVQRERARLQASSGGA